MKKKVETGLIIVKDDPFTIIRRNIFAILFKKEARLLEMLSEAERPRNPISGNIVVPKEMKRIIKDKN